MIEMKDSGIEWIGEIPEHWVIKRFKEMFRHYSTGFTPDSKDMNYFADDEINTWVTIADLVDKYIVDSNMYLSDKAINDYAPILSPKGSLLFSFKLSVGKTAFAGKNLYTNEAIVTIPPQRNNDLRYFYYLIPEACANNATENIYGAKMLNQKIIANMILFAPPIDEQQAIADYLDKKTAEIDEQITALEKKSDAYQRLKRSLISEVVTRGLNPTAELKDSGIEWIGEIPEHWEVKRLKDIAEFYTGNSLNESEKEYYGECSDVDSYPYIGSKDVERGISQINYNSGYRIPKNESKFVIAHAGDTLICIEGGSAGKKFGFVEQNVCFVNKLCCASTSLYDKFSYYYYNSNIFTNQFNLQLQGMIGGVSVNKIKVMSIAIPPHAEQQAIADYLDKKTAEIDSNISAISSKIDAYKRLKQSLIDEVVTGKRRIEKA